FIQRSNDLLNRQSIFCRKIKVALIVTRHRHDRASAVFHQDEISDPDGQLRAVERINGDTSGVDSFLFSVSRSAFNLIFVLQSGCELDYLVVQGGVFHQSLDQYMFWGQNDRVCTVDGIDASCENRDDRVRIFYFEIDTSPLTPTDPVALHRQYSFRPAAFQLVRAIQ